jgi:hypothetical protein
MGEAEPTPVQPIDYRTAPADPGRRTRVVVLVLVILAAIGGMLLLLGLFFVRSTATVVMTATPAPVLTSTVITAPTVDYEAQRRAQAYAQYRTYAASPNQVVYEEDPIAAGKLLSAQPQEHRQLNGGNLDFQWANSFQRPVMEMNPGGMAGVPPFIENAQADRCVLFIGKLTSPGGNVRLVFLDMNVDLSGRGAARQKTSGAEPQAEYEVSVKRKLGYRIFDGAGTNDYPNQLRVGTSLTVKTPTDTIPIRWIDGSLRADRAAGTGVRFYAGLRDPQDGSHCTIDYDYTGRRGTIDVYLTDDDFLRILPRGGGVTGGTWDMNKSSAPATAVEQSATQPAR